ncbi:MAG: DUF2721 domain-containing protein [Fibrobacter sp.]|jgi:hypothetical protein|nr:DUF2721 domain-containing protein [Fibrobacter sp.]
MQINVTTPALLFPAISLLLLAYTSRFLALANLIRDLQSEHRKSRDTLILGQIKNLHIRLKIIRNMQALGAFSFFLCVFSMFSLLLERITLGEVLLGISLLLLMGSLALSIWEIQISVDALELQMRKIEHLKKD